MSQMIRLPQPATRRGLGPSIPPDPNLPITGIPPSWIDRIERPVGEHRFSPLLEAALAGRIPDRTLAAEALAVGEEELPELLAAAWAVRSRHFGRAVKLCVLLNARSGLCPEDCGYCSQAKGADTGIERYRLLEADAIVSRAEIAVAAGARRFCVVCSGRGPSDADVAHIGAAVRRIKSRQPELEICCSLGLLEPRQARALAEAGVDYVNHNLNTSRRHYPQICSTHTYDDRLRTIEAVKAAGLATCSGGIVGMGETDADVLDLAESVRSLDIASIPVNFLIAFDGTPMAGSAMRLSWTRALATLAVIRLYNPDREVRMAAGRERKLGLRQALSLYAANSIFVDGYLTSEGTAAAAAREFIEAAGFVIEPVDTAVSADRTRD